MGKGKKGTFAGMGDIIRLLPESVANQIAAGEVVQRPASAVKELLENAVDAGATSVKLLIKDAGKALIQVIDNGCGMSERDARMCFERHATSKIQTARDLFAIRTLGFRGEALASIASVSQVEMKSRREEDEIGTLIRINGSEFLSQEPVNCPVGTSVSVRNLFYNVPARRNFLKSNILELKYIIEEFNRVALVHPDIEFHLYNQDNLLTHLPSSPLKQRIISILGHNFSDRLIPVAQESDIANISGFIGKPEFAKKKRGEQYFFTNGRYIRNPYLNHAVDSAFNELIPTGSFPSYFIYLEVDPKNIDINIHPTKTEINFQDARLIYALLSATIRQSIGKHNLSPSLDFEQEQSIDIPPPDPRRHITPPGITINPDYNPFAKQTVDQLEIKYPGHKPGDPNWKKLYDPLKQYPFGKEPMAETEIGHEAGLTGTLLPVSETSPERKFLQINNSYIITWLNKRIMIIDRNLAQQRILYERFISAGSATFPAQTLAMPVQVQFSGNDVMLLRELSEDLKELGFDHSEFGPGTFLIHSAPPGTDTDGIQSLIEEILEDFQTGTKEAARNRKIRLARSLAKRMPVKHRYPMTEKEMEHLVGQLMACSVSDITPDGKPTMFIVTLEELEKKFKKRSDQK
jgi:DNA mismatch repair protein MutL